MSLRNRTIIILGLAAVVMTVGLYAASRSIVLPSYEALQEREALQDLARARAAVDAELDTLDSICTDWASWDDTYEFVQTRDPDYVETNLGAENESLATLQVSAVLFLDTAGAIVYEEAVDLETWEARPMPRGLADTVIEEFDVGEPAASRGLLVLEDAHVFVAVRPITTSDETGDPVGTLVMARLLDEALEDEFSSLAQAPVTFREAPTSADAVAALATEGIHVEPFAGDEVRAWSSLVDVDGRTVRYLTVTTPLDILEQAESSMLTLLLGLAVGSVLTATLVWILLDRMLLSRIEYVTEQVSSIAERGTSAHRLASEAGDEIGTMAKGINAMLGALEASEGEVRDARDTLEERVRARTEELGASERRYRSLVENMPDAVLSLDTEGTIVYASPLIRALTGRYVSEVVGCRFEEILTPESVPAAARNIERLRRGEHEAPFRATIVHRQVGSIAVEVSSTPLFGPDGTVEGAQWIARDITERRKLEQQLFHVATHDYLTGLHNRRHFEEELEHELARSRRRKTGGALLLIDVDYFKEVNDAYGHQSGDELLVGLAGWLSERIRDYECFARVGGDEFAILAAEATDADAAVAAANRVLGEIRSHVHMVEGHTIRVTASIGVALYPDHGTTVADLLANADMALYEAKRHGRDGVSLFAGEETRDHVVSARLAWNDLIEQALASEGFVLYGQPIVDVKTREVHRYELLLRMFTDDGDLLSPQAFLTAAERLGLIYRIDRWVVGEAIRMLAEQERVGRPVAVHVNLSGRAIVDDGLLPFIEAELERTGLDPAGLGFELTESTAITDMGRAQAFINHVKRLGCPVALDDFGSGFSSLYYLKHLPIGCLKIDGAFIKDLRDSTVDQHLVRAIVELARGLDMHVAAEFVEDEETLALLEEYDVDLAQGYLLGRPRPFQDILDELGD